MPKNKPQFPLYIPSKSRSQYMMTSAYLTQMNVPHNIVVEPDQVVDYQKAVKQRNLLTTVIPLDMSYKQKYDCCDQHGLTKSTGSGPARNFIWDHSVSEGHAYHWTMDDNIMFFCRLHQNKKIKVSSPAFWRAMEDFCLRYENLAMAGPHYAFFAPSRAKKAPFTLNTRVYSCNLIRNDVPFRWRGRYNEDTILSLDMLTAGWCTLQFNAFLQHKMQTQKMKGGNTDELYHGDKKAENEKYSKTGTIEKSQMLADLYPEYAEVIMRYGRVHHYVNYKVFKQPLKRKHGIKINADNNYGMKLLTKKELGL